MNSIAIIQIGRLLESYEASISTDADSDSFRNLAAASNTCSIMVDSVTSSLSEEDNLMLELAYESQCTSQSSSVCGDDTLLVSEAPQCCSVTFKRTTMNFSGATRVRVVEMEPDQNGQITIAIPSNTCSSNSICAFYDDSSKCWSTEGLTMSSNCDSCVSTHTSLFSILTPGDSGITGSPISEEEIIAIYKNLLLYTFIVLDIWLLFLLIKTIRTRNVKVYVINTTDKNNANAKGYTKTVNPEFEGDKVEKPKDSAIIEPHSQNLEGKPGDLKEERKDPYKEDLSFEAMNKDLSNNADKENQSKIDNALKKQETHNVKSFCSNYWTTLFMKQRFISPILFDHRNMSYFSRGIVLALSLSLSFIIPAGIFLVLSPTVVVVLPVVLCFLAMRILAVPLEVSLYKRNMRLIKKVQIGLAFLLILIQAIVLFIASMLKEDVFNAFHLSIIIILVVELIIYDVLSHVVHVYLARRLVEDPTRLMRNKISTKYFLSPIVYDAINDTS